MNTTYFLNCVAGNLFKSKITPALPTAYYIGLSSTTPVIAGTGATEPTNGGYARVQLTGNLGEPTDGVIKNNKEITFAESTADWGTMTQYVIYDAATGGNLLMFGALLHQRTVEVGTTVKIKVNEITLSVLNPTD